MTRDVAVPSTPEHGGDIMYLFLEIACRGPLDPPATEVADGDSRPEVVAGVCRTPFEASVLQEFQLEIDEWDELVAEYERGDPEQPYHPATLTFQGDTIDVAVRLKGNEEVSWIGRKMQFVVSFVENDPDVRFHGVRKLSFDAPWYDPSMLRERLAMSYFADAGLPYSCAASARLDVGGVYYGVYTLLEYLDHQYVERHFGDTAGDGQLWKYGVEIVGDEKGDPALVDRFFAADSAAEMTAVAHEEEMLLEWAAEAVIGHGDGFWIFQNNFYVYEHPFDGLTFLPWDLDLSVDAMGPLFDPWAGAAPQFQHWLAHPEGKSAFADAVARVADAYDPDVLLARIEAWGAQINDAYLDDPNRSTSVPEHVDMTERMKRTIPQRKAFLESWVAVARGDTADADDDGSPVGADCDDGDASIHPQAVERCDGSDENCDGTFDEGAGCDTCTQRSFEDGHLLICEDPLPWDDAAELCELHGGTLGAPATREEMMMVWVHDYYASTDPLFWAGASDRDEDGIWTDGKGSPVTPSWDSDEPSGGQCGAWNLLEYSWDARSCDEAHRTICRL
jgi:hypothetical protein